jgi:L-seryl-tRNA(Ser) seleniumtransferase
MRALRVDKLTYAALEATLVEYAAGRASSTVPVQRMLTMTAEELRPRVDALARAVSSLAGWRAEVVNGVSAAGGGSAPGVELPTWLAALEKQGVSADALDQKLRSGTPPVIARIDHDRVVLDLRTVLSSQDPGLLKVLRDI